MFPWNLRLGVGSLGRRVRGCWQVPSDSRHLIEGLASSCVRLLGRDGGGGGGGAISQDCLDSPWCFIFLT